MRGYQKREAWDRMAMAYQACFETHLNEKAGEVEESAKKMEEALKGWREVWNDAGPDRKGDSGDTP